jgi:hypothetical protein
MRAARSLRGVGGLVATQALWHVSGGSRRLLVPALGSVGALVTMRAFSSAEVVGVQREVVREGTGVQPKRGQTCEGACLSMMHHWTLTSSQSTTWAS